MEGFLIVQASSTNHDGGVELEKVFLRPDYKEAMTLAHSIVMKSRDEDQEDGFDEYYDTLGVFDLSKPEDERENLIEVGQIDEWIVERNEKDDVDDGRQRCAPWDADDDDDDFDEDEKKEPEAQFVDPDEVEAPRPNPDKVQVTDKRE